MAILSKNIEIYMKLENIDSIDDTLEELNIFESSPGVYYMLITDKAQGETYVLPNAAMSNTHNSGLLIDVSDFGEDINLEQCGGVSSENCPDIVLDVNTDIDTVFRNYLITPTEILIYFDTFDGDYFQYKFASFIRNRESITIETKEGRYVSTVDGDKNFDTIIPKGSFSGTTSKVENVLSEMQNVVYSDWIDLYFDDSFLLNIDSSQAKQFGTTYFYNIPIPPISSFYSRFPETPKVIQFKQINPASGLLDDCNTFELVGIDLTPTTTIYGTDVNIINFSMVGCLGKSDSDVRSIVASPNYDDKILFRFVWGTCDSITVTDKITAIDSDGEECTAVHLKSTPQTIQNFSDFDGDENDIPIVTNLCNYGDITIPEKTANGSNNPLWNIYYNSSPNMTMFTKTGNCTSYDGNYCLGIGGDQSYVGSTLIGFCEFRVNITRKKLLTNKIVFDFFADNKEYQQHTSPNGLDLQVSIVYKVLKYVPPVLNVNIVVTPGGFQYETIIKSISGLLTMDVNYGTNYSPYHYLTLIPTQISNITQIYKDYNGDDRYSSIFYRKISDVPEIKIDQSDIDLINSGIASEPQIAFSFNMLSTYFEYKTQAFKFYGIGFYDKISNSKLGFKSKDSLLSFDPVNNLTELLIQNNGNDPFELIETGSQSNDDSISKDLWTDYSESMFSMLSTRTGILSQWDQTDANYQFNQTDIVRGSMGDLEYEDPKKKYFDADIKWSGGTISIRMSSGISGVTPELQSFADACYNIINQAWLDAGMPLNEIGDFEIKNINSLDDIVLHWLPLYSKLIPWGKKIYSFDTRMDSKYSELLFVGCRVDLNCLDTINQTIKCVVSSYNVSYAERLISWELTSIPDYVYSALSDIEETGSAIDEIDETGTRTNNISESGI